MMMMRITVGRRNEEPKKIAGVEKRRMKKTRKRRKRVEVFWKLFLFVIDLIVC